MSRRATLDCNEIIDSQRVGFPLLSIGALALLVMVTDGFDVAVMGYVAPELLREWGLSAENMVPALSATIIGMMIGGPLAGIMGDRFGRRPVLISCLIWLGILTLSTMAVRNVVELTALRLLAGISLGGAIPVAAALMAEFSPRRYRGRILVGVLTGVTIGIALPGIATALLVPTFGWKSLLLVGGLVPLLIAAISCYFLPESLRYLLSRPDKSKELRRIARQLRPDLAIDDDVAITAPPDEGCALDRPSLSLLFRGEFRWVTPCLWLAQAAIQAASFFVLTWLPTLLQSSGESASQAGLNSSLFSIGGLLSALIFVVTVDRWGAVILATCCFCGVPLVAMMTSFGGAPYLHAATIAGAGFCVIGGQLCITVLLGLFYPTSIRSSGIGTTQAVGRIGALLAPVGGGVLIDMGVPFSHLTLGPAILLLLGGLASAALTLSCVRSHGSVRPREFALT
ncbi:MFS transporter [Accumulibacter sp.]|uniref:MFS transporter n=1 Tax=Accumulibacter sp. TaxID=2053492 RepID=UPI002616A1D6|nr:MFS transporter [Accumulibacter sp.]